MTPRVLKSAGFRFSAFSALLLTGSLLILGPLFFLYIRHSMIQELRLRIEQEVELLIHDYNENGLRDLFHDINERRDINKRNRLLYFFDSSTYSDQFDPIPEFPRPYGWHEIILAESNLKVLLYSLPLSSEHSLAVGGSLDGLDRIQRILIRTLFFSVFITLLLGSLAGIYLARKFLARVDQVSKAAERIGKGNLHERLELSGSGDDFDQLIGTINRMLERIELLMKSIRRVSANVAHELRTPLGHLQQDLIKLEDCEFSNADSRELIARARTEIDRILEIFAALLRISELESGEIKNRFEVVNIPLLLQQLYEIYGPVAEEHGQKLIYATHDLRAACKGDRRLLLQLFANLIENAVRHSGQNSEIVISMQSCEQIIQVSISDNGMGMSPDMIQAAERKLSDLDPGKASDFSRGIGLILVGAIARLHEINISLSNNEPGLRVTIALPEEWPNANI